MKNTIKYLLVFGVGVCIGAFGAIVYTKEKYEDIVQEELASIRDVDDMHKRQQERLRKGYRPAGMDFDGDEVATTRDRYKKIAKQYNGNNEENMKAAEKEYIDYDDVKQKKHEPTDPPYVINIESFNEEEHSFDKVTLYYYEYDDILTEDDEVIVVDTESLVGDEALTCFGDGSDDPEIVYVRNERLGIDYEVIRLPQSYSEVVAGFEPDSGKVIIRKSGERDED